MPLLLRWQQLCLIFFGSMLLNYIGSSTAYIGMQLAPNPGYSLVIQKSYAIYTTFAAVFIFGSEISFRKFLAIMVVLFFAGMLMIQKGKGITISNYKWAILSLISFFCFGTSSLLGKYFYMTGIKPPVLLFWVMFFTTLMSIAENLYKREFNIKKIDKSTILVLVLLGSSFTVFYYFKLVADSTAPNIGYVNAINTASNAFYTVVVTYLFKEQLSLKKLSAIFGMTLGIILVVI